MLGKQANSERGDGTGRARRKRQHPDAPAETVRSKQRERQRAASYGQDTIAGTVEDGENRGERRLCIPKNQTRA